MHKNGLKTQAKTTTKKWFSSRQEIWMCGILQEKLIYIVEWICNTDLW